MSRGTWICWAAAAVGVCAVVAAFAASSTRVGEGFAFGFGAFIVFFGGAECLRPHPCPPRLLGFGRRRTSDVHRSVPRERLRLRSRRFLDVLGRRGIGHDPRRRRLDAGEGAHGGDRINEIGDNQGGLRSAWSFWIGRTALFVGLVTVLMGVALHSTAAGTAVTVGFGGAMMAVIAVWSLLAVDPTHDFLTLAVVGLALFLSPVGRRVRRQRVCLDSLGVWCPDYGPRSGWLPARRAPGLRNRRPGRFGGAIPQAIPLTVRSGKCHKASPFGSCA